MIKMFRPFIPPGVDNSILEVLHSGHITQGPRVEVFEDILAKVIDNPRVASVNSGTSAIVLALQMIGIGPGDEVISTPQTCIATNTPIALAGAKIVWADVHPETGLISPDDIEKKITKKTKAIVTVDWGGMPVDYDSIREIAGDIPIISDAAHSLGSYYKGKPVGHPDLADFTTFSFQAIKTITTIDGGALAMSARWDISRAKRLRWFGVPRDNNVAFRGGIDVVEPGLKLHMNDVNAAMGISALPHLAKNAAKQNSIGNMYSARLSPHFGRTDKVDYNTYSANWLYTLHVVSPDIFSEHMAKRGVETSRVHWRNDTHTAFRRFLPPAPLFGQDQYSHSMMCIPSNNSLTIGDVEQIISAANEYYE